MTYPIPELEDRHVVDEVDWNRHVAALNDLDARDAARQSETNALRANLGTWSGGTAISRLQTLETRTTDATIGNSALSSRLASLGTRMTAVESGETVKASSATNVTNTTASTTYVDEGTSVQFTAPATGRVLLILSGEIWNGNPGLVLLSTRIRDTSTGNTVVSSSDIEALSHYGGNSIQASHTRLVTGLSPGTVYQAYITVRAREGVGSYKNRSIIVTPTR